MVKNPLAMQWMQVCALGQEDPLEKRMATHSSILAWRISMAGGAWWSTVHRLIELDMTKQLTHTYFKIMNSSDTRKLTHCCLVFNFLREYFVIVNFSFSTKEKTGKLNPVIYKKRIIHDDQVGYIQGE